MKFGLIIRGQYPQGDDMQLRLREDLEAAKLAEELGYDLVAKGSHYSSHPGTQPARAAGRSPRQRTV